MSLFSGNYRLEVRETRRVRTVSLKKRATASMAMIDTLGLNIIMVRK